MRERKFYFERIWQVFLIVVCIHNSPLVGQLDSFYVDSLKNILDTKELKDTTQIRITLEIADKLFFYDQVQTIQFLDKIESIINKGTPDQQIDRLHYYGAAYQYLGNIDSTEYFHSKILSLITKEKDERHYARALANLGVVYRRKGELDKAVKIYEEVYDIFRTKSDTFPMGVNRNSMGLIYDAKGDYKAAMKMYLEALDIFKQLGNKAVQSIVLNNIGRVYNAQKDYEKAIKYFKIYLATSKEIDNQQGIANATNNIGSVFIEMNQLDSALYYLNISLDKKKEINQNSEIATTLNNLGKIYNLQGNYKKAIALNEQSLILSSDEGNKKNQSFALLELGKSYAFLGQNQKARSYFNQAKNLADEMGDLKLQFNTNEALYKLYRKTDPEMALLFLENAYEFKDSILNSENTEAITVMRLENEFNQKELIHQQTIASLELREELQASRLANQRIVIFGLGGMLAVLSFLIYKILDQKKKIEKQNDVISNALKEKDVLLREIHHRVKNNLQVISSLLGIQSRKVQDVAAIEALQEGRTRVQSMSLIHQNLYKKDNLTSIEFKDYFDKLIQSLFATYNISHDQVTMDVDIDEITLDVDTMIPLGLIINELISNALKYAFPQKRGHISVTLKELDDGLQLTVKDNGIGIDNPNEVLDNDSYGYDLITSLVDKLEGDLSITVENGTQIQAVFKDYKKAA